MQTIGTLLQSEKHTNTSLNFMGQMFFTTPNCVKALKESLHATNAVIKIVTTITDSNDETCCYCIRKLNIPRGPPPERGNPSSPLDCAFFTSHCWPFTSWCRTAEHTHKHCFSIQFSDEPRSTRCSIDSTSPFLLTQIIIIIIKSVPWHEVWQCSQTASKHNNGEGNEWMQMEEINLKH